MNVTEEDVRNFLMDRSADDNFLLDEVEFDNTTVVAGLQSAVDKYNSQLPILVCYTLDDFPFRYEAIIGAAAYCLRAAAVNMRRNQSTTVTQGGTQLDDKKGKPEFYISLASQLNQEFETRVRGLKVSRNARDCWGIY